MKKRSILLSMALVTGIAIAMPLQAVADRSPKRGISQNGFSYPEEIAALTPGVCWHYNWAIVPTATNLSYEGPGTDMEFCPMAWGGNFDEAKLRTYLTEHPGVKYLLGFNEPNFVAQANMTPAEAAAVWPRLEAIAEEFDLGLVGPAVNYSPDAPYNDPTTWYDEFFQIYPDARVDYIALHCYMINSTSMMSFIDSFAERYGRKIWLTEFCAWDGLTTEEASARKIQRDEMVRKVEALELSDNVFRYAWFMAKGADTYPYYALLKYKNVSQGIEAGTLTDLGTVYVNMPLFDLTYYHIPDLEFAAMDYVSSSLTSANVSTDPVSPYPLQVEGFSNVRKLDYLIDVPAAGEYRIEARVSTSGIPVSAYIDETLVGQSTWEATGEQGVWDVRYITVNLPAGKQRLQLKGTKVASYCDMSTLAFRSTAGVDAMRFDNTSLRCARRGDVLYLSGCGDLVRCEIYDLGGSCLQVTECSANSIRMNGLAGGFYLVRAYTTDGYCYSCKLCW